MDPIVKKILNNLKCPQCGSGIDIKSGRYNYACVADNFHYAICLATDNGLDYPHTAPIHPIIITELVILFEGNHKYEIVQLSDSILGTVNETEILVYETDAEQRVINKKTDPFHYDKKLFDFAHTNREKILSRIKTILVFQ